MKQQTAVEWLESMYDKVPESWLLKDYFDKAKQLERQQIIDAYHNAQLKIAALLLVAEIIDSEDMPNNKLDGEKYYNETYND